jgi:hypothetical protein
METKLRTTTTVNFVRLNVIDDYNKYMNQVDTADQLRGHYRPDPKWFRVRKWWWSIFLWAFGVVCVNAYMIDNSICIQKGAKPMKRMDFLESIAQHLAHPPQQKGKPSVPQNKRKRSMKLTPLTISKLPDPEFDHPLEPVS